MLKRTICPCCGKHEVEEWECCPVCEWTNDPVQADYPDITGENTITLNQAKKLYAYFGTIEVDVDPDSLE